MLLPGAHAIGHTFVEVGRAHDGLYTPEPHALPYVVAHMGEGERDALALQFLDEGQQCVGGAYVDLVHCLCVREQGLAGVWLAAPGASSHKVFGSKDSWSEVGQAGWKMADHADTGSLAAKQANEDRGHDRNDQGRGQ
jgi:hypothetical protein